MSTGGPGFFALARMAADQVTRLAYLIPYQRETYRNAYAFYELWNFPAWELMHPELDLRTALQNEVAAGRLMMRHLSKSPTGEMCESRTVIGPGVKIWQRGGGTILVGKRTIDKVLQFDGLRLDSMEPFTTFP